MQSFKHGFRQFISYLFHPGIMPTVGALFVLWSVPETYSWNTIFKITSTVFVGTYASPLIAIVLFRATKTISSVHLMEREDRIYPYITGAACAFATAAFLKKAMAPEEIYLTVYGTAFVLIVSTILIPYFKSSAHMAGARLVFAVARARRAQGRRRRSRSTVEALRSRVCANESKKTQFTLMSRK